MKSSCSIVCPVLFLILLLPISPAEAEPARTAQVIIAKGNSRAYEVDLVRQLLAAGLKEAGCQTKKSQSTNLNPPKETLNSDLLITVKMVNKTDPEDETKWVHGLNMRALKVATGEIIGLALYEGQPFVPSQQKDRLAKLKQLVLKCRSKVFAEIKPICDGKIPLTRRYTIISHNTPNSAKIKIRGILKDQCQSVRIQEIDKRKLRYIATCQTDLAKLQTRLEQGIQDRAKQAQLKNISPVKDGLTLVFK